MKAKPYIKFFEYMTPKERQTARKHGQSTPESPEKPVKVQQVKKDVPAWAVERWEVESQLYEAIGELKLTDEQINNKRLLHTPGFNGRVVLYDNGNFVLDDTVKYIHSHLALAGIIEGLAPNVTGQDFSGWYKRAPKSFICLYVKDKVLGVADSYITDFGMFDDSTVVDKFHIKDTLGFTELFIRDMSDPTKSRVINLS